MAELPGTDPDAPALIFICHMDTVVIGDGWTMPPFDAIEQDGRRCSIHAGRKRYEAVGVFVFRRLLVLYGKPLNSLQGVSRRGNRSRNFEHEKTAVQDFYFLYGGPYLCYLTNKSLCVPVRAKVNTSTSSSIR